MSSPQLRAAEIKIGTFSVFVKLSSVVESDDSPFKRAHLTCGGSLKQQSICKTPGCNVDEKGAPRDVPRDQVGKVFTHPSGAEVIFTDEELKDLQIDRTDAIEIDRFVRRELVDPLFLARAFFVAHDKEPAGYAVLVDVLKSTGDVGIGRWHKGGKVRLAMIDRHGDRGMVVHEVHYPADVRSFDVALPASEAGPLANGMREALLAAVAHRRHDRFDVSGYVDPEPERLLAAAEKKIAAADPGGAPTTIHGAARERNKKAKASKPVPEKASRPVSKRANASEPMPPPVTAPESVRSMPVKAGVRSGDGEPEAASEEEAAPESKRTG